MRQLPYTINVIKKFTTWSERIDFIKVNYMLMKYVTTTTKGLSYNTQKRRYK